MYQAPRGTQDILPEDVPLWEAVENEARRQARLAGFGEIRTPTFEDTQVFQRGVGAATDIVEKEMYTFLDKGGDSMTLRPEGTAAVMRAYLQRGMANRPSPVKLFSLLNVFRYDRPQKGRLREFHQVNLEVLGEDDPLVDAELVSLQWRFYAALGLQDLTLQVNSIGDGACRPAYVAALAEYFRGRAAELCDDCRRRLSTNPLRLLDDKNPGCQTVLDSAPRSAEHLCDPCHNHFESWLGYLTEAGVPYTLNARLVRGLEYYTRSVWEVWPPNEGAQSTLGGGGRYDGLAEQLGGRPTPGAGFATGIERLVLEMRQQGKEMAAPLGPTAFFAYQGQPAKRHAFGLAEALRTQGIATAIAFGDRKLGKQLSAADRAGALNAVLVGDSERAEHAVTLKPLRNGGEQRRVPEQDLAALVSAEAAL